MAATARATTYSFQLFLRISASSRSLISLIADHEHDGSEYRIWQVAERLCQEQQNQEDRRGSREMRYLAATACRINHGRLGWAAVDDKRTA